VERVGKTSQYSCIISSALKEAGFLIELRRIRADDCDQLLKWANAPEVADYMYRDHEITPEEHDRWFRAALDDPNKFIVTVDSMRTGFVQCSVQSEIDRCWTWGHYLADPNYRDKGLGQELDYLMSTHMFDVCKAAKITIECFAWNTRAIRCHTKFGYRQKDYLVNHIWKAGKWHDVAILALLLEEWRRIKASSVCKQITHKE
jgi:UDP-4-amino-4,6-dideoxy-N-acetyl-beta-L-altrosamine N-acetyltransferase